MYSLLNYRKSLYIVILLLLPFLILKVPYIKNLLSIPSCTSCNKVIKIISIPNITQPKIIKVVVKPGDNITSIFKTLGISNSESYLLTQSLKKIYNIDKIRSGDQITIKINGYNQVNYITINTNFSIHSINVFKDNNDNYISTIVNNIKNKKIIHVSDTIKSSLFNTAAEKGLFASTIMKLIELYGHSLDLRKEIVPGSKLDILLERFFDDKDNPILDGRILYTSLKLDNKSINLYHYLLKNGDYGYFDNNGISIKKGLLQNPLDSSKVRISSKFGARKHPIHGYTRFHKGVDYAVSIGTPIKASADGVVEYIGIKNGYGKYIKIKHNNYYSTAYAHINNFHGSLKLGSSVKQGQIIAYVGNTGTSTAPHLHYEVLYRDKHIDPEKVITVKEVKQLPKHEISSFKLTVDEIHSILNDKPYITELAMN